MMMLALIWAAPAAAQYYYPYPVAPYGPPPLYRAPGPQPGARTMELLPPDEIRAIVRNLGYGQVGMPTLKGRTYLVNAVGAGGWITLAVDGYTGRIGAVAPRVAPAARAVAPRHPDAAPLTRAQPVTPPVVAASPPRPSEVEPPAQAQAKLTPDRPSEAPPGTFSAGMGTTTPGDTVSAGSPSALSRGMADAH